MNACMYTDINGNPGCVDNCMNPETVGTACHDCGDGPIDSPAIPGTGYFA